MKLNKIPNIKDNIIAQKRIFINGVYTRSTIDIVQCS